MQYGLICICGPQIKQQLFLEYLELQKKWGGLGTAVPPPLPHRLFPYIHESN